MNVAAFAAVGLYAALNTFILMWIAWRITRLRHRYKVWIGDGGNAHLLRAMRGHANAIENIPMALILMLVMAAMGAPLFVLHIFGVVLTAGRALHAWHFTEEDAPSWQRFAGSVSAELVLGLGALGVLGHALWMMAA
jgi:uncharacterized membrane protein YecN with MAPEG domain